MRSRRVTTLVAGAVAMVMLLSGCALAGPGASAKTTPGSAKNKTIALLTVSQTCDYCARHTRAFEATAAKAGAKVDVVINEFNAAVQAQQVIQIISKKPDVVVLWPADATAVIPSLARFKQAHIPVIIANSAANSKDTSLWKAYAGPNDLLNGELAAKVMVEGLKAKKVSSGQVFVVTGVPGTSPAVERLKGFKAVLAKELPNVTVAGTQPGNWDQTQATTAGAALFTQYPKAVGVYAEADNMMAGVLVAAKRAGIDTSKLVAVGSNCTIEGYNAIKAGTEYGTVLQSPIVDGQNAADVAIKVLEGKTISKNEYMKTSPLTKQNLASCKSAVG